MKTNLKLPRIFFICTLAHLLISTLVFAQPPEKMSYQAVIRNSSNQLVISHTIGIKISILQGSSTGSAVYVETQTPATNANGLVSMEIGGGTIVSGTFSGIDWSASPYFIKTETDPTGGSNYTITGTSQILSVPYALYTKSSGNGFASVYSKADTRPVLDKNGNIGIGASPNWAKLNVNGSLNIGPGENNWGSQLLINATSLEKGKEYKLTSISGQGKLYFECTGKGTVMAMDSNLNVGIGTSNPVSKLDVMGEINVNSNKITNVAEPVNATDAATKAYVDAFISQLSSKGVIVTDASGNIYSTIRIGSQVWMAENLKTTKYNDGTDIPNITDATAWSTLTTGAYCNYNNILGNSTIYGKLYNFYTVVDARKLCPTGWHVPSDAEWTTLTTYLGGGGVAGGKLKETSTMHWTTPNFAADNTTGFTAIPGGYRNIGALDYIGIGDFSYWWSSTEGSTAYAWDRALSYSISGVGRGNDHKSMGLSVRCVRD